MLYAFQNSATASFADADVAAAVETAFASSFPVPANDSRTEEGVALAVQLSAGDLQSPPQLACSSLLGLPGTPADTLQAGLQIVKSEPGCANRSCAEA